MYTLPAAHPYIPGGVLNHAACYMPAEQTGTECGPAHHKWLGYKSMTGMVIREYQQLVRYE